MLFANKCLKSRKIFEFCDYSTDYSFIVTLTRFLPDLSAYSCTIRSSVNMECILYLDFYNDSSNKIEIERREEKKRRDTF